MRILAIGLAACLIATSAVAESPAERAEIEQVFDRSKGGFYAEYSRALKVNPGLKGRVDLEISISADGQNTGCRIVESQLGSPDLEGKLCERVRKMRFAPRAAPIKVIKRVDFFPAA